MGRERLGQQSIFTEARRLRVLLNQSALPPGSTANEWANIILIRAATATSAVFPVTAAGLTDALAAASSGDMVWIPPSTLADDFEIPTGVGVTSMGNKTFIEGQVTLNANTHLYSIILLKTYNEAGTVTGVIGPATGTAYLDDTSVKITNTGAGDVHAVAVSEGGDIEIWACDINGNASGGGDGYGIIQTSGDAFVFGGRVRGSTAPFSGTVQEFSFKNEISLLDSAGALVRLYPMTEAGFAAAEAASTSGDIIKLAVGTIAGNHTIDSGVTVLGLGQDRSILSGAITTAGTLENLAVSGSASPQVTQTAGFIRRCAITTSGNVALNQTGGQAYDSQVVGKTTNVSWNISGGASGWFVRIGGGVDCSINANQGLFYCNAASLSSTAFNIQSGGLFFCSSKSVNGNGFVKSGSGTAQLYNSEAIVDGSGVGLLVNTGGTLRICNVRYENATINGTLTYERGDRGAYEVETFHAEDIEDGTETRHTPAPVAQGDMIVADGNPYNTILSIGNAHEMLKVNAGGTDPAWEAFDWDEMSGVAGADMVHDHSSDAEGGAGIVASIVAHDHSSDEEGGTDPLHEEVHNEDHSAACDGEKVNFITANEYEPERIQVYLNGSRQRIGSDYTEDGTLDAFTLDEAPLATDTLIIDYVAA